VAKYIRYRLGEVARYGQLQGTTVHPLDGEIGDLRPSDEAPVPLQRVILLAPTVPSKIIAIGPNYRVYFADGGIPPSQPMLWTKPATCLNHPEGIIELPAGHTVNHESELALVIGKRARDLEPAQASHCIFGYTCMNDVTAGDFATPGAFAGSHYFVDGKVFDTFAPIGPLIETDLDVSNLKLQCRVNGEVRQSHSTSDCLFTPAFLVSVISKVMTLLPGDVVSMGSPPGVAPLQDGDTVEIEIEHIGTLRNFVRRRVAASSP
jgi:2-keto-4-pentenoate hydratase/2-oxohepta-3-ene-1,7-dioic acid hydratase in catechol pathway